MFNIFTAPLLLYLIIEGCHKLIVAAVNPVISIDEKFKEKILNKAATRLGKICGHTVKLLFSAFAQTVKIKISFHNLKTLKDYLSVEIKQGSKLSIAAACFSIYAFQELKEQLSQIEELRFINRYRLVLFGTQYFQCFSAIHELEKQTTYIPVHLLDLLEEEISSLSQFPNRFALAEEEPLHNLGIHKMPVKNYLVYFWIKEAAKTVHVTAIVYGRRDQVSVLSKMNLTN